MATTALQIITTAAGNLNAFQLGETPPPDFAQDALQRLNWMMGSLGQQPLTIPAVVRSVFPLLANKGGPADPGSPNTPYTVGLTGDLPIVRPPNQNSLVGAGLLLSPLSNPVEIPRRVLTDDEYFDIRLKNLSSTLFTSVFYSPDFANDLGTLYLWPVPSDLTNSLVIYVSAMVSSFADLVTQYTFPPGYERMLHSNLSIELSIPLGKTVPATLQQLADTSLGIIKRSNIKLATLTNDFVIARSSGRYDILTGDAH